MTKWLRRSTDCLENERHMPSHENGARTNKSPTEKNQRPKTPKWKRKASVFFFNQRVRSAKSDQRWLNFVKKSGKMLLASSLAGYWQTVEIKIKWKFCLIWFFVALVLFSDYSTNVWCFAFRLSLKFSKINTTLLTLLITCCEKKPRPPARHKTKISQTERAENLCIKIEQQNTSFQRDNISFSLIACECDTQ